jgi:S-adenosyl-L-methionine hydrolase (adenosine-forming)
MPSIPLIAVLTDFGDDDPFVGIMKGVIANITPQAKVVDITQHIPPGDVRRGAIMLWQAIPYFPSGSIFLVVVDPGVGTTRRGIIADSGDHIFVGPDNGVFSFIGNENINAWELTDHRFQLPRKGNTFHGRDIFAPAAAYAAKGIDGSQFGNYVSNLFRLDNPRLEYIENQIHGEVLYSDRFGNLLTSFGRFLQSGDKSFHFDPWVNFNHIDFEELVISINNSSLSLPNGKNLAWVDTFADLPTGECGFLVGSSGLIEIIANRESAGTLLGITSGAHLTLNL